MPVAWGIVALVALVAAQMVPVLSARSGGVSEMRWCRQYHAGVPSANDEWNAEMSGAFWRSLEALKHKTSQNDVSDWKNNINIQ